MATNNLCRLCLAADDLFWIFGEENNMVKVKNTISMLTGIQIRTCDLISQMICGKCYQFITQILQFREQCLQADKHFQDYMDHFDIKPCISSEPTIDNITQIRKPRCKCEQNIPDLHPTIVDVFHSYPKIKLPSKCLKLNVKPIIQMPLDLIENPLKALELDQCAKNETKKLPCSIEKDETEKENVNVTATDSNKLKDDDKVTGPCKNPGKIDCNKSSLQSSNTEQEQSITKKGQIYSNNDSASKRRKYNDISKEETKTDSNNSKDDKIVAEHFKTTKSSVGASSNTSFLQSCKKKLEESTTKEDQIRPSDDSSCKKRKLTEKEGTISEKTSNSVKKRHKLNANGNVDHNETIKNWNDKEYSKKKYNSKKNKGDKSDDCLNKSSKSISTTSNNKEYNEKRNSSKEIFEESNTSRTDSFNTDYEMKLKTSAEKETPKQQSKQKEIINEKSKDSIIDYSAKNDKTILTSSEKECNKKKKHSKEIKTKLTKSDDKIPHKNRKNAKDEEIHNSITNGISKNSKTVLTKSSDKESIKKPHKNQFNPKETNERPNDSTKYSPIKYDNDSYSLTNVGKSVPLYVCEICNAVHNKLFQLEKHQRKHMRCQFCKVIFRSLESKKSHIENACLKREIMMNDLPNVVLPKIEKDATITQKYPEAFFEMIKPVDTSKNAPMIEKLDVIEIVSDDDIPVMIKRVSPIVPDVTVSASADLGGIDDKVLSKLRPLFRKSVHDVGSQTILPTNDDIKITEPGEAVLEKLIDQLHHYSIPVEIQAGDFNVSYTYNFEAKTPKKMCLWSDITPIL